MSWFDPGLTVAGLVIGFVVGLTGMGGGALMTPVLVLIFKVDALTAVSSDLVVSLFMKPAGAIVHLRRRTVDLRLVGWLCVGSVPAAFSGIAILRFLPQVTNLSALIKVCTGVALIIAASGLALQMITRYVQNRNGLTGAGAAIGTVRIRPLPTVLLGAAGGLIVGLTSVGAGSIIVVVLLFLYPSLRANRLVGTDLVQAIPLVASATLAHLLFGSVSFATAASLLIGAIPAVWLGARSSSRAPERVIKAALFVLLLASGASLLGLPTFVVLIIGGAALIVVLATGLGAILLRRRNPPPEAQPEHGAVASEDSG
ncbi:MAG TPA: sulfite exporter TauE/SafE family protein [Galbitalea sp.]|jgi:hypothetical protein|nr:sulfite exporter TauE/SafE family protein [Galbitalea sp.]